MIHNTAFRTPRIDRAPTPSCKLWIWLPLLALVWSGCGGKPELKTELSGLEKAFPAAVSAPQPVQPGAPPPLVANSDANIYVQGALNAVRANDYAGGVVALDAVQRMPKVTQQQLMAVERAKQAINAELQARAARGDAKALADLAAIEKTRSQ